MILQETLVKVLTVIKSGQRGQALIEFSVGAGLLLIALKGVFYLIIFLWMQIWANYNLNESLICQESTYSKARCETYFYRNFKSGQFLFKATEIKWNKNLNSQSVILKTEDFLGFKHSFTKNVEVTGGKL